MATIEIPPHAAGDHSFPWVHPAAEGENLGGAPLPAIEQAWESRKRRRRALSAWALPPSRSDCRAIWKRRFDVRTRDVPSNDHYHLVGRFGPGEVRDERVAVVVPPPSDLRVICERWPITPWERSSC